MGEKICLETFIDIFDLVLTAGAYRSTSLDPKWNPRCDVAEPYGIIDMFDVVMIAGSYREKYSPRANT